MHLSSHTAPKPQQHSEHGFDQWNRKRQHKNQPSSEGRVQLGSVLLAREPSSTHSPSIPVKPSSWRPAEPRKLGAIPSPVGLGPIGRGRLRTLRLYGIPLARCSKGVAGRMLGGVRYLVSEPDSRIIPWR